jgi:hypothetical protein
MLVELPIVLSFLLSRLQVRSRSMASYLFSTWLRYGLNVQHPKWIREWEKGRLPSTKLCLIETGHKEVLSSPQPPFTYSIFEATKRRVLGEIIVTSDKILAQC